MYKVLTSTENMPYTNYGTCVFEAKTASVYKADQWCDSIPDEYLLQLQHYLSVSGYAGAYIAVLIGGNTFRWQYIERNEELIAVIKNLNQGFGVMLNQTLRRR